MRYAAAIAALAEAPHGVVDLRRLGDLGVPPKTAHRWARTGRLHRKHPGVYAIGRPELSREGIWLAAVYACGPGAVLSHRDAGALHGLVENNRPVIELRSPGRRGRRLAGLRVREAADLTAGDVTIVDHIPCTAVARTLLDVAAVAPQRVVERAIERAEILRVFDLSAVLRALSRSRNRRARAGLESALSMMTGAPPLRSELERLFLALCEAAGLPRPLVNHVLRLSGLVIEVDFVWPEHRLAVELDGFATHGTRAAFERDRERDQVLLAAGWRVARFTWRQVTADPEGVARRLLSMLQWSETPA